MENSPQPFPPLSAALQSYADRQPAEARLCLEQASLLAQQSYPAGAVTEMGQPLAEKLTAAAETAAQMDLLADAVAAVLLSALPAYLEEWEPAVTETCGSGTAALIAGFDRVTRLTSFVRTESLNEEDGMQQAEAMRQMLLAMVSDIRVVLITLALRAETLKYLAFVDDEAVRRKTAKETLEVLAPLANRLGIWQLKWQLEDLGFRYTQPDEYKRIARLLDEKRTERLDYIEHFTAVVKDEMEKFGLRCEVAGRPKHIYSIYKKMVKKKLDFDGLYDIRAVRILVDTVPDCYTALGIVHSLWQPVPGEFDDYIAHPKPNDYRSLHTVVVGPEDKGVEIQIRTFAMHRFAEFGVAAHWRYKEGGKGDSAYEQKIAWLRRLLEWRETVGAEGGGNLSEAFKTELFDDTIYVLSPHGKVFALPAGSTPIDFAYALHSDLGNRCRGAKVDGQIVPLSTSLENGQRVEIIAAKEGGPSVNWLHDGWVKSSKAVSKVRAYIRRENGEAVRETGKHVFEKEWGKMHPKPNVQKLTEALGFQKTEDLYTALGQGDVSARAVRKAAGVLVPEPEPAVDEKSIVKASKIKSAPGGILIDGESGLLTTPAGCCKPAPGDDITGFVTRDRGISIHRTQCPELRHLAEQSPDKILPASWSDGNDDRMFAIGIEVRARDRSGLLRDVSDTLTRNKVNVTAVQTRSHDLEAVMRFTLEIKRVNDLSGLLSAVGEVKGVTSVSRL